MAQRPDQKILRIGIIQGGKIIEERLVRSRESVTLGSAPKNTFVVPASTLPKSLVLFEAHGQQYHLAFTDGMDGRVSVGEGVLDFASLKSQQLAKKKGAVYSYPLQPTARGKVVVGDVTLLFQFVTPPPEPPKPQLPKEARGGWVKSIDKFFTALLAISFALHLTSIMVLERTPLPKEMSLDQIPDRFAKLIVPDLPKDEPKPEPTPGEGENMKPKDEPKQAEEPPEEDTGPTEEEVKRRAASKEVQEKVRSTGLLAVIGVKGDDASAGSSMVADIIGSGGISDDLDTALKNVSGVGVASGSDAAALKKGLEGGNGQIAGINDLKTSGSGSGKVGTGKRKTPRIKGNISAGNTEVESSTVDARAINRFIKVRMRSIVSCYEAELKRNPSLRGKLVVRIVINTRGMVGDISIEQDTLGSSTVTNCVRTRIRPWRFPVKPEEDTPVAVPFIFAPSS